MTSSSQHLKSDDFKKTLNFVTITAHLQRRFELTMLSTMIRRQAVRPFAVHMFNGLARASYHGKVQQHTPMGEDECEIHCHGAKSIQLH